MHSPAEKLLYDVDTREAGSEVRSKRCLRRASRGNMRPVFKGGSPSLRPLFFLFPLFRFEACRWSCSPGADYPWSRREACQDWRFCRRGGASHGAVPGIGVRPKPKEHLQTTDEMDVGSRLSMSRREQPFLLARRRQPHSMRCPGPPSALNPSLILSVVGRHRSLAAFSRPISPLPPFSSGLARALSFKNPLPSIRSLPSCILEGA